MRYHLFVNSFREVIKIADMFFRKLVVPRDMSTSVYANSMPTFKSIYSLTILESMNKPETS